MSEIPTDVVGKVKKLMEKLGAEVATIALEEGKMLYLSPSEERILEDLEAISRSIGKESLECVPLEPERKFFSCARIDKENRVVGEFDLEGRPIQ
jgi:hypothetical protein